MTNHLKFGSKKKLNVQEVGSRNNVYCGINGFHYVALGNKIG